MKKIVVTNCNNHKFVLTTKQNKKIVTKLKKNCDDTQEIKFYNNSKTQVVTTQKLKL